MKNLISNIRKWMQYQIKQWKETAAMCDEMEAQRLCPVRHTEPAIHIVVILESRP